jgi:glycine/D-amino acid oxidase-like deaminating enzyme
VISAGDVLVIGAGIFGITAALELRARGARVTVLDPGPIPHPDASSTDISKLVRLDYGSDVGYVALMEVALERWRAWNAEWSEPLFHETGIAVLSTEALRPGTFEGDSLEVLGARGHVVERLDAGRVSTRFPAWAAGRFADGYFNPKGGWVESGRVVHELADRARREGVRVEPGVAVRPFGGSEPVEGATAVDGTRWVADTTLVAAGAHTPVLIPELADRIVPIAQNVFHFVPSEPALFVPPVFAPWAADIGTTGWYGFPFHAGVVKVANHGPGVRVDPAAPRAADPAAEERFRAFFASALPALATAPRTFSRACLYSDSFDGDFFIDRHPERRGLAVASGGSGHALKFAPLLGRFAADAIAGTIDGAAMRFRWRARGVPRHEDARFAGR